MSPVMWLSVSKNFNCISFFFPYIFSLMLHTRAVPWINQEEFETVYKWLFADRKQHVETIRRALDRVNLLTAFNSIKSC